MENNDICSGQATNVVASQPPQLMNRSIIKYQLSVFISIINQVSSVKYLVSSIRVKVDTGESMFLLFETFMFFYFLSHSSDS